jgi:biopolymer transport protein ExbD
MLALLFLFLGETNLHWHPRGSVDLPEAQNAVLERSALREDVMRIAVARDGSVYFRQTRIGREDLPKLIRTALQEGAEKKVYLAGDRRAKNESVKLVLDQIRLAGITSVVILTEESTR